MLVVGADQLSPSVTQFSEDLEREHPVWVEDFGREHPVWRSIQQL